MIRGSPLEITAKCRLLDVDAHCKVTAGPGAGKTKWLKNHVINVAKRSTRLRGAERIACITFTNAAARELEDRIDVAGVPLEISTIHSFLYRNLVKPYARLLRDNDGTPLIAVEELDGHVEHRPTRGMMLRLAKERANYRQFFRLSPGDFRDCLESLTWNLNEDGFCEIDFHKGYCRRRFSISNQSADSPSNENKKALLNYKKAYWQKGAIHHEDVLYFAYRLIMEQPRLLGFLSSRFPYIFLDEFQDTNPIQTQIVKALGEAGTTVGVIGDVAQSIYSFQGAWPSDFVGFTLPDKASFEIRDNWRSSNKIVEVLNKVHGNLMQKSMLANEGLPVKCIVCPDIRPAIEQVRRKANQYGLSAAPVVLVRKNQQVHDLVSGAAAGLDVKGDLHALGGDRFRFLSSLATAVSHGNEGNFHGAIREISRSLRPRNGSSKPLKEGLSPNELRAVSLSLLEFMATNQDHLFELPLTKFYNRQLVDLFEHIGYTLRSRITSGGVKAAADRLSVKDLIMAFGGGKTDFDSNIEVMTIHKAKGQQFYAVLVGLESGEKLEEVLAADIQENEERRVLYVAMSRAKQLLALHVPSLSEQSQKTLESWGIEVEVLSGRSL